MLLLSSGSFPHSLPLILLYYSPCTHKLVGNSIHQHPNKAQPKKANSQPPSVPPRYRYDIALLYLKQADYNLDAAIEAYKADEKWERDHPMDGASVKGKAKQGSSTGTGPGTARRRFGAFGVAGQLS